MQKHAELAVQTHFKNYLQKLDKNSKCKSPLFSNDLTASQIDTILDRSVRQSMFYKNLLETCSYCERPSKYLQSSKKARMFLLRDYKSDFNITRNQYKIKSEKKNESF